MPLRSFSIAALSPNPLIVIFAPCAASARAIAKPMPEVEPVTKADFSFNITTSNLMTRRRGKTPNGWTFARRRKCGTLLVAAQHKNQPCRHVFAISRQSATLRFQAPLGHANDEAMTTMSRTIFPAPDHDHERCANAAIARAEAHCTARAQRLTPMRRQVLETLLASHKPLGAYEIIEHLADKIRPAPITIYRALD